METKWEGYNCEAVSFRVGNPKDDAATPLKLTNANGQCIYIVVTKNDGDIGKMVVTKPDDGRVIALCDDEASAVVVAAALNIASSLARANTAKIMEAGTELRELGFDERKIDAEIRRLDKEGKSKEEIYDYIKSHKENYRLAGRTPPNGGEW